MTIDLTTPSETKSLIEPSQGILYPANIPFQHNQLKNYISTANPNTIYYASAFEIYALNVFTRTRKLIKSLPWKAFCLDAAHGWICVGGDENGQCAFISIVENGAGGTAVQSHAEVDDLLPVGLDPGYRQIRHDIRRTPQWPVGPKYELQHHELGGERVNSVKIHLLRSPQKALVDEVVAVMANNDRTVRIFSLSQSCLLQTLDFPTRMNHASISPDGNLLLAVGDEAPEDEIRAFFCRRTDIPSAPVEGQLSYPRYEWHEIAEPRLSHAGTDEDACFCTAFSDSGHMCAVASQSGVITIFDTAQVRDEMETGDAVIAVLRSSRPSLRLIYSGAVRSMCFSPAPWDLFAWAEDQGRVCVVDLRNVFQSRQTIELEIDAPDLDRADVGVHDGISEQRQLEIERRFVERHREALEAQDHLAAVSHTADYLELTAERRRIERETAISGDNLHPLSTSERQMIDSIGLRRVQGDHSEPSGTSSAAPMSLNYTPNRHTDAPTWAGLPSPTTSSNLQNRSTASIHDYMRQRNLERSRASDRSYQPRRRSSVVISNANSDTNTSSPHRSSSSLAPIGTAALTLSASASHLPINNSDMTFSHLFDASDPWQTIADAMGSTNMPPGTIARLRGLQSGNLEHRTQATAAPQATIDRRMQALQGSRERSRAEHGEAMEAITNRARETNARASRQIRASRADVVYDEIDREVVSRRLDEPRRRTRNEDGVVTMGLGWSPDGRNLFVATEEGILEYPVNVAERKTFPGVAFL